MALRADTARHIITAATVLIFSAAAIGTAMRYQERGPAKPAAPAIEEAEAADEAASGKAGSFAPTRYVDGARGSGADISARLDGTVALGGGATAWPFRQGGPGASSGSAAWWGRTTSRMTPTGNRGGGAGSAAMPGSGYTVSGGRRNSAQQNAHPPANPGNGRRASGGGNNGNGSGSGGGASSGSDSVFDEHTPSVGDLVDDAVDGLDGVGAPGVDAGFGPGDLSHTPEPASLLLMATGVAGVIAARRRRQTRRQ